MSTLLESFDDRGSAVARLAEYRKTYTHVVMFEVPGVEVVRYGGEGYDEIFKPPAKASWLVAVEK